MIKITCSKESILLIEPKVGNRDRLTQAARSEKLVSTILTATTLDQALGMLRDDCGGDLVFISHSFPYDEVLHFIAAAKNTPKGKDAAFIALLSDSSRSTRTVAQQLLHGMDGFLSEPFSTEMVNETIAVAIDMKRRKLKNRIEAATKLLLKESCKKLDYRAYDAKYREKRPELPGELKEAMKTVQHFHDQELQVYFQVILDWFERSQPPVEFSFANRHHDLLRAMDLTSRLEAIRGLMWHPEWQARARGIDEAAKLGDSARDLVGELIELQSDPSPTCRRKARMTLVRIGDTAALQEEGGAF